LVTGAASTGTPGVSNVASISSPPVVSEIAAAPVRYRLADCHLHLVDFLQRTDGIKVVLEAMNKAGVDHTMISGMPLMKQWAVSEREQPQYYLDDDARCYWYSATDALVANELSKLSDEERKRFHPFICGINSADRNAIDHVRRMLEWYPGLWEGIGEIMSRHDDLTALTYGDPAMADSVSLDPIYTLAAENDLPVSVHSNASSVWRRQAIYLSEMENAVSRHPKTKFIWCHTGISRRINIPTHTEELRRMLKTYPNIWMDISWVVFEDYITKDGKPLQSWIELIEEFPNRFMIGSDKVGKFSNYPAEIQKYYVLLDALKPDTAKKVAGDNFVGLLPKKK
jgi:hypothetical protein